MSSQISVEIAVQAPLEKVWSYFTEPEHIVNWCFASDDWCAPQAENDLRVGGKCKTRMEAKDGSVGFDFEGTYTIVEEYKKIEYTLGDEDGRRVHVEFIPEGEYTRIIETFDPEGTNSLEMQKNGWQAILDNFKKYVEA